jgi:hypothetical protein
MISQNQLPFQYEISKTETGLTAFAGLPLYVELASQSGLIETIKKSLKNSAQGWGDDQIMLTLILLNLIGGDCVDDVNRLEADEGMSQLFLKIETFGMRRQARRLYEKRWRKEKVRAFPSASAIHRFLNKFHHGVEEDKRVEGKALIPAHNMFLTKLLAINSTLLNFAQLQDPCEVVTLDQDATLAETNKREALYSYKKFKAYQPLNTYWHEKGLLVHSEFRDGNVPAGFQQTRCLEEALLQLPEGIKTVRLRSDSAGYQEKLLQYCAEGKNERFGIIDFAIAARVSSDFKTAVKSLKEKAWKPIYKKDPYSDDGQIKTEQEYAEVCFVPNWVAVSDKKVFYRYIAIREALVVQEEFECIEEIKKELPFQTISVQKKHYKLFAIVTNRDLDGNELIHWHRERCGDSEKIHSIQKADFAGGQFPSKYFGANAAWWHIMILSLNLNRLMQEYALPKKYKTRRMKSIRLNIIGIAGKFIQHARGFTLRLGSKRGVEIQLQFIRDNIANLLRAPPLFSG